MSDCTPDRTETRCEVHLGGKTSGERVRSNEEATPPRNSWNKSGQRPGSPASNSSRSKIRGGDVDEGRLLHAKVERNSRLRRPEVLDVPKHGILREAVQELHKHERATTTPLRIWREAGRCRAPRSRVRIATSNLHNDNKAHSLQKSAIKRE